MDSTAWDERYAGSECLWTTTVNRFVHDHRAGLAPGTVIDLGAGEGRNAVWLAQQGWRVIAVDFSEAGLAKGRRLAVVRDVADLIDRTENGEGTWEGPSTDSTWPDKCWTETAWLTGHEGYEGLSARPKPRLRRQADGRRRHEDRGHPGAATPDQRRGLPPDAP